METPFLYSACKPEASVVQDNWQLVPLVQEILVKIMDFFVGEESCGKTMGNNKKMSFIFLYSLLNLLQVTSCAHLDFSKFLPKSGHPSLPPPKISSVYFF